MAVMDKKKLSLLEVTKQWINEIICEVPLGEGKYTYIINKETGDKIKYIEANCDSLRHNATNYEQLLKKIKAEYKGLYKEAILNTIKYEATRQAVKKQHSWIHNVHKAEIIEIKSNNINQQLISENKKLESENKRLICVIDINNQELEQLRKTCKELAVGAYVKLQAEYNKLEKDFVREQEHRKRLGKNNQSLGAYKGLYSKVKKENEAIKEENTTLKTEIEALKTELKQWIGEN